MDQLVSRLLLYGDLGEEAILSKLAALFQAWKGSSMPRQTLVRGIYHQVKGLLGLATEYGFDENLWQNYLTFLLMTNENSFSLITERVGAQDGSVNHFARNDFRVFRALFHYDFSAVEGDLNLDCFTTLSHYKAIAKHGRRYNQNVSEKVRDLSRRLAAAPDDETFFRLVTEHYRQYGVGMLGLNKAFRIQSGPEGIGFIPIYNTDKVMLPPIPRLPLPPMASVSCSIRSRGKGGRERGLRAMDISFMGLSSHATRLELSLPHRRHR